METAPPTTALRAGRATGPDLAAVPACWERPADALAAARAAARYLPVLRHGRRPAAVATGWENVALRLRAALWEVAARAAVEVAPGDRLDAVANRLVGAGALSPAAGEAVRALSALAGAGCLAGPGGAGVPEAEVDALARRVAAHLALRARFG